MSIINRLVEDSMKKENDFFMNHLINNAIPKIKGDITEGKLKWRGIKMVIQKDGLNTVKWIEQRGNIISPKYQINMTIFV